MEGASARGAQRGYELHVSYPNPQTMHHDMGFVQLEDNHGPSFMVTSQSSPFPVPQVSVPFNTPITFSDNLISKPWDHHDQMESAEARHVGDQNCTGNDVNNSNNNSWWRSSSSDKNKVKVRRKLREPRFCFQTRSDVDVLDDGYKWRKYGQKVVKNSLHPSGHQKLLSLHAH